MSGLTEQRAQQLADDYAAWSTELGRHYATEGGGCICGAPVSPCVGETTARRKLIRADAEWRAAAGHAAETAEPPADTSWVPGGETAQHDTRPAPSTTPGTTPG